MGHIDRALDRAAQRAKKARQEQPVASDLVEPSTERFDVDAKAGWSINDEDQPDVAGHCVLKGLQPGACIIGVVWTPQRRGYEVVLCSKRLDLRAGANRETIELPVFHDLTVTWDAAAFGSPAEVIAKCVDQDRWQVTSRDRESTRVVFDFLPSGIYDVTVQSPLRQATRRVTLDRSTTLDVSE